MARRLLLKEDQLTSTGNPPSGYQWIGYNGATFSERQSDGDIIKTGNPRPYKVYTALLNQGLTASPVPTVLENTIGNINWTRITDGEYRGELNDGFVIGKTTIFITANTSQGSSVLFSIIDTNTIELATSNTADALVDDLLSETPIEIRVYN
jgi:ABC-type amino acid transport system permease subunit